MGKVRPALNVVIGDKAKDATLAENGGLVVKRSVFEVKGEASGDDISTGYFEEIAMCEDLALLGRQGKKTVQGAFRVLYVDGLARSGESGGKNQRGQECGTPAA